MTSEINFTIENFEQYHSYQLSNKIIIILQGSIIFNNDIFTKNFICECENVIITPLLPTKLLIINYPCFKNKSHSLNNFKKGWFLGNFYPTIDKNERIELGLLHFKKNENLNQDLNEIFNENQNETTQETFLIKGKIKTNDKFINENEFFHFSSNIEFLTDCEIFFIKTPS